MDRRVEKRVKRAHSAAERLLRKCARNGFRLGRSRQDPLSMFFSLAPHLAAIPSPLPRHRVYRPDRHTRCRLDNREPAGERKTDSFHRSIAKPSLSDSSSATTDSSHEHPWPGTTTQERRMPSPLGRICQQALRLHSNGGSLRIDRGPLT